MNLFFVPWTELFDILVTDSLAKWKDGAGGTPGEFLSENQKLYNILFSSSSSFFHNWTLKNKKVVRLNILRILQNLSLPLKKLVCSVV